MESRIRKYLALLEQGLPKGPAFSISGHFTDDGGVHISQIGTVPDSRLPIPFTDYDLILLDASGAEIACNCLQRETLHVVPPRREDWEPGQSLGGYTVTTHQFNATLPRVDGGVTLAIEHNGVRLWTRHAPKEFPTISDLTCEIVDGIGQLRWSDNVSSDSPEYRVRAWFESADGIRGSLTRVVADNSQCHDHQQLPRNEFLFSVAEIAAGIVSLSIALDTGFYTKNSDPLTLIGPEQPIRIEVLEASPAFGPDDFGKLVIYATAHAFAGTSGTIKDPAAFEWMIDGRPAGHGVNLIFDPPALGGHVATVVVRWKGQRASQSVEFEVTPKLLAELAALRIAAADFFPLRCSD